MKLWKNAAGGEFVLLLSVAMISVCLWFFVEIVEEVGEGDHTGLEEQIIRSTRRPGDPGQLRGPSWLAAVARASTALGGTTALTLVSACSVVYLLLKRRFASAVLIITAVGGGVLLTVLLKHSFGRSRPEVVPALAAHEATASFPSGHSMSSAVVYITLGALLARATPRRRHKCYLIGLAFLLSGAIGISRVALGVHYPSDVLAGWSAGTAWALLCWMIGYWLQRRSTLTSAV